MIDQKILNWMTRQVIGDGEQRITLLAFIKKEPHKAKNAISAMMVNLVIGATAHFGEEIVIPEIQETAQEIVDNCSKLFAEEFTAIE